MTLRVLTSDRLRPLKVSVHSPFKRFTASELENRVVSLMSLWPGKYTITEKDVWKPFLKGYEETVTLPDCKSGFKKTDLWPLNPHSLCNSGKLQPRTGRKMITIAEYKWGFCNIFVAYTRIGLPGVRTHSGYVDTRTGVGLIRNNASSEIHDIESARQERRKGDEASKSTDQVWETLGKLRRWKFHHRV